MHMLIQMMAWWFTKGHVMAHGSVSFLSIPTQRVSVTKVFSFCLLSVSGWDVQCPRLAARWQHAHQPEHQARPELKLGFRYDGF